MKKLTFLLALIISFIYIGNVSAKVCRYEEVYIATINDNKEYDVETFEISNGEDKAGLKINITGSNGSISWSQANSVTIKNWNKSCKALTSGSQTPCNSETTGLVYNADLTDSCPGYVIITTYKNSYEAYIASDKNDFNIIKQYEIKYGKHSSIGTIYGYQNVDQDGKDTEDYATSCKDYGKENCENNRNFACMWVEKTVNGKEWNYCNYDKLTYVSCGTVMDLPSKLPSITSFLVNILKIATPIILIVVSMLSLIKAVAASKEDDIKKAQNTLIKRLIAAALVFFIIQITQFVMLKVSDEKTEHDDMKACLSCLLNNSCAPNLYYKTQGVDLKSLKKDDYKDGQNFTCTYQNGEVTSCF